MHILVFVTITIMHVQIICTNNMQVYRFEKADVPEDEELDTFVEALMELRVSLSTYKEM